MQLVKEDTGIKLLKNEGKYYLEYDAGAHMAEKKRIEISLDEAEMCQYSDDEMYHTILYYQNKGVYGDDV